MQQLERRLDNVVYRLGFAVARRQARQLVRHGHLTVNGHKIDIPSYQVKAGDEIAVREKSNQLALLAAAKEFASHQTPPNWLEVDREAMAEQTNRSYECFGKVFRSPSGWPPTRSH